MKKFFFFSFFSVSVLLLAGCTIGAPPPDTSYLHDAEQFKQSSGINIPRTLPAYITPGPATNTFGLMQSTTPFGSQLYPQIGGQAQLTVPVVSQVYTEALNIYRRRGAYFQFVDCHGNPGTISIKKGVNFMLDNRDGIPHVIRVGNTNYELSPYDYAIAVTPVFPLRYPITCDGGGAAELNVQN